VVAARGILLPRLLPKRWSVPSSSLNTLPSHSRRAGFPQVAHGLSVKFHHLLQELLDIQEQPSNAVLAVPFEQLL